MLMWLGFLGRRDMVGNVGCPDIPSAKVSHSCKQLAWIAVIAAVCVGGGASAGSAGRDRTRLNDVLTVLRLVPGEASASCLASMRDVHRAELSPYADDGRIEFSYENASQICGVDALRVCRTALAGPAISACSTLQAWGDPRG